MAELLDDRDGDMGVVLVEHVFPSQAQGSSGNDGDNEAGLSPAEHLDCSGQQWRSDEEYHDACLIAVGEGGEAAVLLIHLDGVLLFFSFHHLPHLRACACLSTDCRSQAPS